jgi:excisionase family DNA binding protein
MAEYLSLAQVALELGVHRSTVHRWADTDSSMPVLRLHGVVRIERSGLERWLTAHTQRSRRTTTA